MMELAQLFDDPRWIAMFLLVITTITVAALLAHHGRRVRAWPARPAPRGLAVTGLVHTGPVRTGPADPATDRLDVLPTAATVEPVGTVVLAVTPYGTVRSRRIAELAGLTPGVTVRIRRADLDVDALVAALPPHVAALLADLAAAPGDAARNAAFRRSIDELPVQVPCAAIVTGPAGGRTSVALTVLDVGRLIGDSPEAAALLARAAHDTDRRDLDTALLAAARARPAGTVVDLDGLLSDRPWVASHRAGLRARYATLLGAAAVAS